ncbi:MAG: COG4705 family protein [Acidimicrobiales bacterium]
MPAGPRHARSRLTVRGAVRVPEVGAIFWFVKALSTAMGEATSDFMVHTIDPVVAVLCGFGAFCIALVLQFRQGRYVAWSYWLAVAMVGVFGTMAADVLHVAVGVPYPVSTIFYALVLAAVFVAWWLTERTLSMHCIDTPRREGFYWAAVVATFAMGTALGDFTAYDLHLGYLPSAILFAGLIAVPAFGFRWLRWNAVLSFWFAYVVTRPLGASVADGLGKPASVSGLGLGDGWVALAFGAVIFLAVAYLSATRADARRSPAVGSGQA